MFCEYVRNVKVRYDGWTARSEAGDDDVKTMAQMCAIRMSESTAPLAKPNSAKNTNCRATSGQFRFDMHQQPTVSSGGPPEPLRYHSLFTTVKLILF